MRQVPAIDISGIFKPQQIHIGSILDVILSLYNLFATTKINIYNIYKCHIAYCHYSDLST